MILIMEQWAGQKYSFGPKRRANHVGNFCFSPIHGDTRTGALIYTPSYYIGHFSKFIGKSAKISSVASRSQLLTTSFLNQDGKVVTVVMNESDVEVKYNLYRD
jgi:glucosylceramidase